MLIDNVEVTVKGFVPFAGELAQYVAYAKAQKPNLTHLHCRQEENGDIALDYVANNPKFERIRRITGKEIAVHRQAV